LSFSYLPISTFFIDGEELKKFFCEAVIEKYMGGAEVPQIFYSNCAYDDDV
jgi:hypothetical protein